MCVSTATTIRRWAGRCLAVGVAVAISGCTATPLTDTGTTAETAEAGRMLVQTYGCTSCHQVPGVEVPQGTVGPPLGDFADRSVIAGQLPHSPENAVRWIMSPKAVNPETVMPDLDVTEEEAQAIVEYLYSLD